VVIRRQRPKALGDATKLELHVWTFLRRRGRGAASEFTVLGARGRILSTSALI
jgi:hypothetical protein